jgi:hypothetical protein
LYVPWLSGRLAFGVGGVVETIGFGKGCEGAGHGIQGRK